ncbi:MAG: TIGR03960 family B12-binding radical SAM protein [Candidatus Omnitrophota bacterium]|nr:TIGR03960 family B12-binding radical SAM protein [Candidatus Omnitrophota bacterium]
MNELKEILNKVQKPGRYVGEETNSVRKRFEKNRTTVLLAYPDTYEIGMSYLGMRILYHLLNERDDIICERVFAPWGDMEKELKRSGRKLFGLESKTDMDKFDIIGFSLSYELTYTNVLNMLFLGGVSVKAEERSEEEPLVIAGGACCYNPEPVSSFFDAFLIGDGEESLPGFIDAYRKAKRKSRDRKELLKSLAGLPGVYVPSLYKAEYAGKQFLGLRPREEGIPDVVERTIVEDFENAYYPMKQIVPLVKIVHDRTAVEIMRGCPHACRFCQATAVNRPVRIRSKGRVRDICRKTYEHTGNERIALLSLSSVNYPDLAGLVRELNEDFTGKGVGLSIPSLRVDESFYKLPEMISAIRKTGLTFAPESASKEIRDSIGKRINFQVLCKSASLAFQHGWRRLKLYFMVGFPGEPENEADRIIDLARDLSCIRKKASGGAADIKVSVNPFVPKPHTPFQWIGMKGTSELSRIKDNLNRGSTRKIKVEFHDLEQSLLEACLSRGDRRLSEIIFTAWKKGAKMDCWKDFFDFSIWEKAFEENGRDIRDYARKNYDPGSVLPWDHIKTGVDKGYLREELRASSLYKDYE